jgi:hypothetical protein
MGRMLISGFVILLGALAMLTMFSSESQAQGVPTDTPTPTASETPTPTASATATPTTTASASVSASASVAASASPVQPAAVPLTGGNPSDGSPNLALILAIALGAVVGTGGVLAGSYGLTRRS